MSLQIRLASKTQKSPLRVHNEDAFGQNIKHKFFILADGVGGNKDGGFASSFVVEKISKELTERLDAISYREITEKEAKKIVNEVICKVNLELIEETKSRKERKVPCTTLCILLFVGNRALCAHVGDSRIYLIRRGELLSLTRDHSLINDAVESGLLDQIDSIEEAKRVITKAVGVEENLEPTLNSFSCQKKDLYLICSDGLTDVVEDEIIAKIILQEGPLEKKVANLVDKANTQKARDDISIVLIEILESNYVA